MNGIVYYSNTNESLNVASYLHKMFGYVLCDLEKLENYKYKKLVVVFPVYSQNIPFNVKIVLKKIKASKIILIATYGKMSFGRVLYEAKKLINGMVVGAAYIPTKHTYIKDDSYFTDFKKLDSLLDCFNNDKEVFIPKDKKNILANILINKRARSGVKLIKSSKCVSCNICHNNCHNIRYGKPNNKCIRCLKCLDVCPVNALTYKINFFTRCYLKKTKKELLIIYR